MDIYSLVWVAFAFAGVVAAAKFAPFLSSIAAFTYPNAKFNAIGSDYLQEKELSRLIGSKNLEDFKNNVVTRDFLLEGESIEEIQKSIDASLAGIIRMASRDSPEKVGEFYDSYLQKLDARAIKDAVKAAMEGKKVEGIGVFSANAEEFIERIKEGGGEGLPKVLSSYGMDDVRTMVEANSPFAEIECAIDRKIIDDMGKAKVPRSCIRSRDIFVKRLVDVLNIKAILRAKYYDIEGVEKMLFGEGRIKPLRDAMPSYEKEGVPALEIALDRQMIRHVANIAVDDTMGLGPGIRFIVEKEFEARNLKAIAKGVGEGLPAEKIWKLMVME